MLKPMYFGLFLFFFAFITGLIGRYKGSSFFIWFLVGGLLPIVGLFAVLLSGSQRQDPRRECPNCGNVVGIATQVCPRCGEDMDYPEEFVAPRGYEFAESDAAEVNGDLHAENASQAPLN
jgi:hypothetical protein